MYDIFKIIINTHIHMCIHTYTQPNGSMTPTISVGNFHSTNANHFAPGPDGILFEAYKGEGSSPRSSRTLAPAVFVRKKSAPTRCNACISLDMDACVMASCCLIHVILSEAL